MSAPLSSPRTQGGSLLLEALIAILIFSFGILGIVGMQAVAVRQSTDARYRADAAQLVDRLIGTMWAGDRTISVLQATYSGCTSTACKAWAADVARLLPGATAASAGAPTVNVSDAGVVTVSIFWRAPGETTDAGTHRYDLTAQIR